MSLTCHEKIGRVGRVGEDVTRMPWCYEDFTMKLPPCNSSLSETSDHHPPGRRLLLSSAGHSHWISFSHVVIFASPLTRLHQKLTARLMAAILRHCLTVIVCFVHCSGLVVLEVTFREVTPNVCY